ncbi:hypothetical protein [Longispora urticae]
MAISDRGGRRRVPGRGDVVVTPADPSMPRQAAVPMGTPARLFLYAAGAVISLIGPALLVAAFAADLTTGERWPLAGGGVLAILIGVPCTALMWNHMRRAHRDSLRLAAAGVDAVAEIIMFSPAAIGDEDGVELVLWISGPGFGFEALSLCRDHPSLVAGARLNAIVDPSDHLFAIVG